MGISPRNVLHMRAPSATAIEVGSGIAASLQPHQFEGLAGDHVLNSISVLPLDGTSAAETASGGAYTSGSGSGDRSPATSIVVSHHTLTRGPRGRGRTYIGPIVESVMQDGLVPIGNQAEIVLAWEDFQTALQALGNPIDFVVASYKHATADVVTSERCDAVLGTQRRRQDQLR